MAPIDFPSLIRRLTDEGGIAAIARNPRAQFGTPQRPRLGARLMPERLVPTNAYTESNIRLLTIIANAGPRYGPVQIKNGQISASFDVVLGHSDIGRELSGQDLDAIREYLAQNMTLPALANLSDFADIALNRALTDHNERNIWDAIVDAQNTLLGDNGFETVVEYIDPPGHRVAAGGDYTDPTYDPIPDLIAGKTLLATKGKRPAGIYASTEVLNTLLANPKVQARTGNAVFIDGAFQTQNPMTTPEALNRVLLANGLPPVTTYDEHRVLPQARRDGDDLARRRGPRGGPRRGRQHRAPRVARLPRRGRGAGRGRAGPRDPDGVPPRQAAPHRGRGLADLRARDDRPRVGVRHHGHRDGLIAPNPTTERRTHHMAQRLFRRAVVWGGRIYRAGV
jgi:hypothetical protein